MIGKVVKIIDETHDVKTFFLELDEKLKFIPGQFINVSKKIIEDRKEKLIARPYSIASPPSDDLIQITLKEMPGGYFSKILFTLKVNDELTVRGPFGKFNYKEDIGKDTVLIGAGTGIAPLMCMLRHVIKNIPDRNATLIYSARTPKDIIFRKELDNLNEKDNIKVIYTLTRYNEPDWTGHTGRINIDLIKKSVGDLNSKIFYLCGPPKMVENTEKLLLDAGVEQDNIKTEKFN